MISKNKKRYKTGFEKIFFSQKRRGFFKNSLPHARTKQTNFINSLSLSLSLVVVVVVVVLTTE
jgi:hypothetical protein